MSVTLATAGYVSPAVPTPTITISADETLSGTVTEQDILTGTITVIP